MGHHKGLVCHSKGWVPHSRAPYSMVLALRNRGQALRGMAMALHKDLHTVHAMDMVLRSVLQEGCTREPRFLPCREVCWSERSEASLDRRAPRRDHRTPRSAALPCGHLHSDHTTSSHKALCCLKILQSSLSGQEVFSSC